MIAFHRFLIATAILFSVLFAVWAFAAFRAQGGSGLFLLGAFFVAAAAALAYYLKNLDRFLHR